MMMVMLLLRLPGFYFSRVTGRESFLFLGSMGPQPLHASSFFAMDGVSLSTAAPNCVAHSIFSIANPSVN
jgi:hypothetical protein